MVKCTNCMLLSVSAEVIDEYLEDFDSCAYDNKKINPQTNRECDEFIPFPDKNGREWFR